MRRCEIGLQKNRLFLQELCLLQNILTSPRHLMIMQPASWDGSVSPQQTADQCSHTSGQEGVRTVGRKVPEAASNCQARMDPSLPPENSMPAVVARASTSAWCPGRSCCCPVCMFHTCIAQRLYVTNSSHKETARQHCSLLYNAEMVLIERSHARTR